MALSDNINGDFIGDTSVNKQDMRDVLDAIGNSFDTVDAYGVWRQVDEHILLAAAGDVKCLLPTGYGRYRIEWQDVRGVGAAATLQMRASLDGVTYDSTSIYHAPTHEFNVSSDAMSERGGTQVSLSGSQLNTSIGAFGFIELAFQRHTGLYECAYITTGPVRNVCKGMVSIDLAEVNAMQFLLNGGAVNLAIGSSFTVLART